MSEKVEQGKQPEVDARSTVEFDEATLDRIVDKLVDREIERQAPVQTPNQDKARELAPKSEITVGEERTRPWDKRAVTIFNAVAAQAEGAIHDFRTLTKEVVRMEQEMGSVQREAERKIAEEILRNARTPSAPNGYTGLHLQRAMDTLTGAAGGFAVPTPLAAELFVIIEQGAVARAHSRPLPMTSKSIQLSSVATKPTVYWTAEEADFTESDMVLSQATFSPYKLTALTSWTRELDEDQAIALLPVRVALIGEGFAEKEDLAFFQGDGTSTYGNVTGLLNLASANTVTMASTKDAHTDATFADLRALRDSVSLRKRRDAVYFMHPDILSFFEGLANGTASTDHPAIVRDGNGDITRIWGHRVVQVEDMPATAGADAPFVAFGAPSRYALRGQRAGFEISTSDQGVINNGSGAVTFNAIQNDGVILSARQRIGYVVPVGFQSAFGILSTAAS